MDNGEYYQSEGDNEWKQDNRMNEEVWEAPSHPPEDRVSYGGNERGQQTYNYSASWQNQSPPVEAQEAYGGNERQQPAYNSGNWENQPREVQGTPGGDGGQKPFSAPVEVPQYYWRDPSRKPVDPGTIYSLNVGFGQTLYKMPREAWGAAKPLGRYALANPVSKVRFTQTGTDMCTTNEECMKACRDIQKYYMDLGFPDIPWNFMVGGDGVLYHGRGWVKQADRPQGFNSLRRNCIDVAYIGNFEKENVPYEMLSVSTDFLKYGLKVLKITPFYQVYSFIGEKHANPIPEEF